ncbi:MAG: translation initiation factor [Vicinamibacteria bacterium]|nr:translation initiation factor [Vicinamibacteria bacterium]
MARERESRLAWSTDGAHLRPEPRPEAPAVAPGATRLRLERRAAGRLVTVVTGLPGDATAAAALAQECKRASAAGGAFKDGVLELQGDQRERVEAVLRARGVQSKRAGGDPGGKR